MREKVTRNRGGFIALVLIGAMGCAFVDPEEGLKNEGAKGDKGPALRQSDQTGDALVPSGERLIRLVPGDGTSESEVVSPGSLLEMKRAGVFTNPDPLLLAAALRDQLKVAVRLPTEVFERLDQVQGKWSSDSEGEYSEPAEVSWTKQEDPDGSKGIQIQGPFSKRWYRENEESVFFLTLFLKAQDEAEIERHVLMFSTPPSKLRFEQLTAEAYHQSGGSIPPEARQLLSVELVLHLLQVLTVQNQSWYPVDLKLPVQLQGDLKTRFSKRGVIQHPCSFAVEQSDWTETLSSGIYLVPLEARMELNFRSIIDLGLAQGGLARVLAPGEKRLFGIYATGGKVDALASGTFPRPVLSPTQVVTGCKSRCVGVLNQSQFQLYWMRQDWPGASKTCFKNYCCEKCKDINEAKCNKCREWDESLGFAYDDARRRCVWGKRRSPWEVEKSVATVQVGTQSSPIVLELGKSTTAASARYAVPGGGEGAARTIEGILLQKSIQAR